MTVDGYSRCKDSGLYFWPSGQTVCENSIFVIDGYLGSQEIITGFETKYKVYLKSGGQIVNLKVQETLVGQFGLTQAILRPETNLTVGETYELIINNLPDPDNELSRYSELTNHKEKIKWTVIAGQDTIAPKWRKTPKFKNYSDEMFGCGPKNFAIFTFSATDNSELLIKTVVKNLSTGIETIYYLKPDSKRIAVGHGMCSGAFDFGISNDFEVEFSLFDASGNITAWADNSIKIKRPALKKNERKPPKHNRQPK